MLTKATFVTILGPLALFMAGCANSSARDSGGGGNSLFVAIIIGLLIWAFSRIGQYHAGFRAGQDGNPKNIEHRFLSEDLGDSYSEGYRDGQLSNLRNKDKK